MYHETIMESFKENKKKKAQHPTGFEPTAPDH